MVSTELLEFLDRELLINSLSPLVKSAFLTQMKLYMSHARRGNALDINRRKEETVEQHILELKRICTAFGFNNLEIVLMITKNTSIIHDNDLYNKFLFTGIIFPNKNDEISRREMIVKRINDLRISLALIYARYSFALSSGYYNLTWNALFHSSEKEFASIFVKGKYNKPYQIDCEIDDLTSEKLMIIAPINEELEFLKKLKVNESAVETYEGKKAELCI